MSKLAIFLCFLVAASSVQAWDWGFNIQDQIEQVKNKVTSMIQDAMATVRAIIDKARNMAMEFADKLKQRAKDTMQKMLDAVDRVLKKLDEEINKMTGNAEGVDITQCTMMADQMRQTALNMVANASTCVVDKIDQGSKYIDQINIAAKDAVEHLSTLKAEAEKCTENFHGIESGLKSLWCVNSALAKAGYTTVTKIPKLAKEVTHMAYLVNALVPSLALCSTTTSITTFMEDADSILTQIRFCVEEKLNGAQHPVIDGDNEDDVEATTKAVEKLPEFEPTEAETEATEAETESAPAETTETEAVPEVNETTDAEVTEATVPESTEAEVTEPEPAKYKNLVHPPIEPMNPDVYPPINVYPPLEPMKPGIPSAPAA